MVTPNKTISLYCRDYLLNHSYYEKRQTSMIRTTVVQFMLEVP